MNKSKKGQKKMNRMMKKNSLKRNPLTETIIP